MRAFPSTSADASAVAARRLRTSWLARRTLALAPVALLIVMALLGPALAPQDPLATGIERALQAPSAAHCSAPTRWGGTCSAAWSPPRDWIC